MNDNEPQTCIVLRSSDYKEADKILTLYSRKKGIVTAQARGARRIKSELKAACQPFCCGQYEFYIRNNKNYIKNVLIKKEFNNLQLDYNKYIAGLYMLELTRRISDNLDISEKLFSRLVNTLYELDEGHLMPQTALSYFLTHIAELTGIFPLLDECAACGKKIYSSNAWSHIEGGLLCEECIKNHPYKIITKNIPKYFKALRFINPSGAQKIIKNEDQMQLLAIIIDFLNINLEINMHTFKFLS